MEWRNRTHQYMLEPIPLSAIRTITSMHCNVRRGIGAQMMRVVNYAHFALNKFESLKITFWYIALPLTIFDYAFHTSSTMPNPYTNFSHNHNVHSRLQHSLLNLLSIKTCYSLSHVVVLFYTRRRNQGGTVGALNRAIPEQMEERHETTTKPRAPNHIKLTTKHEQRIRQYIM